jgi:hypothetical protein
VAAGDSFSTLGPIKGFLHALPNNQPINILDINRFYHGGLYRRIIQSLHFLEWKKPVQMNYRYEPYINPSYHGSEAYSDGDFAGFPQSFSSLFHIVSCLS